MGGVEAGDCVGVVVIGGVQLVWVVLSWLMGYVWSIGREDEPRMSDLESFPSTCISALCHP